MGGRKGMISSTWDILSTLLDPWQTASQIDWQFVQGWPSNSIPFTQCPQHARNKEKLPPPHPEIQQHLLY